MMLFWEQGQRFARLLKSPSRVSATVMYDVTECGVRSKRRQRNRKKRSSEAAQLGNVDTDSRRDRPVAFAASPPSSYS